MNRNCQKPEAFLRKIIDYSNTLHLMLIIRSIIPEINVAALGGMNE